LGIIAVGLGFAAFFHIFTKEPSTSAQQKEESKQGKGIPWYKWFTNPQFYAVSPLLFIIFFKGADTLSRKSCLENTT
jgi:hypothetical protein